MRLTPTEVATNAVLNELQENLGVPLDISQGLYGYIAINVQLLMAQFPGITPKRLYYATEEQVQTLPGSELFKTLERVAAASLAHDMRRN